MSNRKLFRSRDKRVIAGVCGGLGEYFNIDPAIVRIVAIAIGFFSAGLAVAAYAVGWLILPDEGSGITGADRLHEKYGAYQEKRDSHGSDGPSDTFHAD